MRVGSLIDVGASPDPHPNPSPGGRGAQEQASPNLLVIPAKAGIQFFPLLLVIPVKACSSSQPGLLLVIPAKAGIQFFMNLSKNWIPAFAGMTIKAGAN